MSADPDNRRTSLIEIFKAVGAIVALPLALFALANSIIAQPIIALVVALITAILVSVCVVRSGWIGIPEMIIAWLTLIVVVLAGFVIWPRTMTVEGTILDTASTPISHEKVVLIDVDGVRRETSTDTEGHYQFKRVPCDPYKVRVRGHEVGGGAGGFLVRSMHTDLIVPKPTPTPTSTVTPMNTLTPTLTPIATPTSTPTLTPTPAISDAVIVAPVNLRSGPGTVYDIICTLSPNQALTVTGRIADTTWLQVITDQMQEGWVINRADLVTLNLPAEQIPIVSPPPTPTPPPPPTETPTPIPAAAPPEPPPLPTEVPAPIPVAPPPASAPTETPMPILTATPTHTPAPTPTPCSSTRLYLDGPPVNVEVQITSPRHCDTGLATGIAASGTYSGDLTGKEIWILVYPTDGKYYPQTLDPCKQIPSDASGGNWRTTIGFGGPPQQYDVVAVVTDTDGEASQEFKQWLQRGCETKDFPGYLRNELPDGITEMDAITVSTASE